MLADRAHRSVATARSFFGARQKRWPRLAAVTMMPDFNIVDHFAVQYAAVAAHLDAMP